MNAKVKAMLRSWRVVLLLVFLLFAIVAIKPQVFGVEGVAIRSVVANSSAANAGIAGAPSHSAPTAREHIVSVNGIDISSIEDYYLAVSAIPSNTTVRIETDRTVYTLLSPLVVEGEGVVDLGIKVKKAAFSNLRMGLDLEGGTISNLNNTGALVVRLDEIEKIDQKLYEEQKRKFYSDAFRRIHQYFASSYVASLFRNATIKINEQLSHLKDLF